MTIERLEQYAALRKEVSDLAQRRDHAAERAKTRMRAVVQASASEFPYQRQTAIVKGNSIRRTQVYALLTKKYERKEALLLEELTAIEDWLDTMRDSRVRQLIRHHYIDGKTWAYAARRVYGHPCEDAARMLIQRFFAKF